MSALKVELVAADRRVWVGESSMVRCRTASGELGILPAWVVPPAYPAPGGGDRWAILVHGRGARREEALRAIGPLHELGWTALVPNYRNDEGVVAGPDGRYNLGLSEWRDIEAAIDHAARLGAQEIVLVGWSMGGAIVLQFLDRSPLSQLIETPRTSAWPCSR